MPSLTDLLSQLEESKRQFGNDQGERTARFIGLIARRRFGDAESLIRFHEALLFIRAHPQGPGPFFKADEVLSRFEERVEELRSTGVDMTPFDYIEYSGIAGTTISGAFSYDIDRHIVNRYPASADVEWGRDEKPERLGSTLPRLLPLLYEDSLVEASIPYLDWLRAAKRNSNERDLPWLIRGFEGLKLQPRERAELFDSLGLRVRWDLRKSRASRTRNMRRVAKPFYHTEPLIGRTEVSLDREFQSPPFTLKKLSRSRGEEMQNMLRDTTTVRYRELYGITHGNPDNVVRADVGRGVEIFLWGLPPKRRLPLRAYHAGFTLKNGVPINYIEGITICERMEIGFNTFYTFREGESAWVYAKVLRLLNQLVGVTCISIDPYQIGFNNQEAIESGALWFYRKMGFRPAKPGLAKLMASEERKLAADPRYRTAPRTLRRLSAGNVIYEMPGSTRGDWDRFAIRNLGLAVQARMSREFDGDAAEIRRASAEQVALVLGTRVPEQSVKRRSFEDLALVFALIPELAGWSRSEKRKAAQIIRAKTGADESEYARLLQSHAKLRAAIIRLGETPARS